MIAGLTAYLIECDRLTFYIHQVISDGADEPARGSTKLHTYQYYNMLLVT
jgi:hypothetical protein